MVLISKALDGVRFVESFFDSKKFHANVHVVVLDFVTNPA